MKKALWTDLFREIWRTKARFLSILAIIALGVGFYAGIKATGPDMLATVDNYYDEYSLMDAKVLSAQGITADALDRLRQADGVQHVQPGYSIDVFLGESGRIGKVFSYEAEQPLNRYKVIEGRLPVASGEIAIDDNAYIRGQFPIGEFVTFMNPDSQLNLDQMFHTLTYEIVGYVRSPQFIDNVGRGSSHIGKGTADAFVVIPDADFRLPVYTEAYVSFNGASKLAAYSDRYEELVETGIAELEHALSGESSAENKGAGNARGDGAGSTENSAANGVGLHRYYVMDRSINPGYAEYSDNAERLSAIATVFPVFFFLIAALVSLTTMTRMVEEQRTQIGTYKALGYSNWDIMLKFLVYGTIASITASAVGLAIGYSLFPVTIYATYGSLYNLTELELFTYAGYSLTSIAVALLCTTLTAVIATRVELRGNAAMLMRPKAPKIGQRMWLERMPFIWRRLSFIGKVTARNLFRYKQRMFMTMFGVAGCMALIVTGFGLKGSISDIADLQYGELMKYQATIALGTVSPPGKENEQSLAMWQAYDDVISGTPGITGTLRVAQDTWRTTPTDDQTDALDQNVNLFVPESADRLEQFVALRDRASGAQRHLTDDGVVVTEKLAKLYKLEAGSTLTLVDLQNNPYQATVSGITENYAMHHVYISPAYYETVFGRTPIYNTELLLYQDTSEAYEDRLGEQLNKLDLVRLVSFTSRLGSGFANTIESLDMVVIILIVSAAALAFVVLYNLTNINVSERIRELSTIKVLGFYDKEVTMYIYRENISLTVIGILLGSYLGVLLHGFVLVTAEIDILMFIPTIQWPSYVYSAALTLLFSGIVMLFMHRKLRRIDMIEALKSVE